MDTTAREELKDVAEDVVETGQEAMGGFKKAYEKGRDTVKRYASQARDTASEYAKEARDKTEMQIRDKPFWAMMIAAGVGLSLGLIFASVINSRREDY